MVQEEQNQNDETDQVVTAEDVQKAVDHNEVEKKEIMDDLEIEAKEEFRDPTDFAKYVSKVVFNFQNGKMAAEDYYNFIQQHGSEKLIEGYPETKAEAMVVLETLQNMLIEKRDQTTVYILSEVGFNRNKREGYYYRLEKDGPDESYYITTIVAEDDIWKFEDDSPSSPFEVEEEEIIDEKELDGYYE